jgi:uncharacterized protein
MTTAHPRETYWVVIAGLPQSGKTTFMRQAADKMTARDRQDMSLITQAEHMQVLDWLNRTGGALDPDRINISDEERLFTRWARRVTVGEIDVDHNLRVYLYEAPGTREFDFLWHVMSPDTYMGAITIIDSTQHETIREASRLAATFAAYAQQPYIFAVNKQDQPDAMPPSDIEMLLHFLDGHTAPVVPCVAKDTWSVKRTIIRLLELIRDTYDDAIIW